MNMNRFKDILYQRRKVILHLFIVFILLVIVTVFVVIAKYGYLTQLRPHDILGIGVVSGILLAEVFGYLMDEFGLGVIKLNFKDKEEDNEEGE